MILVFICFVFLVWDHHRKLLVKPFLAGIVSSFSCRYCRTILKRTTLQTRLCRVFEENFDLAFQSNLYLKSLRFNYCTGNILYSAINTVYERALLFSKLMANLIISLVMSNQYLQFKLLLYVTDSMDHRCTIEFVPVKTVQKILPAMP